MVEDYANVKFGNAKISKELTSLPCYEQKDILSIGDNLCNSCSNQEYLEQCTKQIELAVFNIVSGI